MPCLGDPKAGNSGKRKQGWGVSNHSLEATLPAGDEQGAQPVQILWRAVGAVENADGNRARDAIASCVYIGAKAPVLRLRQLAATLRRKPAGRASFPDACESNFLTGDFPRSDTLSLKHEELEKLKHAPATPGLLDIIRQRWSPRAYSDKPVEPEALKQVFEAARWAASSFNEQPWRFLVGHKGDETYKKIFDSLVEFNQGWAKSAPVLILSAAKKTFTQSGKPNQFGLHDTGAANSYIALQATALGFHTHSMAGFDHDKVRKAFHIPDDFEIGSVTALGYLGDPEGLSEQLRNQETAPRQRKALEEIVFSEWERPLKF
jgi:nitroreductase